MASTYENDLRLEEMATGENSGSWGTKTNTNLELIADAFSYGTETIANADTTITIADGAADAARSLALKINSSADLTTTRTITLAPNTTSKVWIIENNTSGGQTLTISAGSGSNITLLNGQTKIIATDGIGAGSNVVELTQDIAIADLFIDDDLSLQSDGAIINFGADDDITLTHAADTSLTLGGAGSTTGLVVNNTATDGDPFLAFALSGTQKFTMGVDDGDSDKFKIGTTAIGTNTRLTIDSTGDVEINQGNFTVTSIGTGAAAGPYLNLSRNSSSPADDDAIGIIQFNGKNDQDESLAYVQIQTNILDATDATEDGYFRVNVRANGSLEDSLTISNNNIIFNDSGLDRDFRVESDSNTHMLFVDAGENAVKIGGTTTREGALQVFTSGGGVAMEIESTNGGSGQGPILQLRRTSSTPAGNDYLGGLNFVGQDSGNNALSYVDMYTRATTVTDGSEESQFSIRTRRNGTLEERVTLDAVETTFNQVGADIDFRVESDTNTHMLFVNAGLNRVGIGESGPLARLHLKMGGSSRTDGFYITRSDNDNHQLGLWTSGGVMYYDAFTDNASSSGQFRLRHSRNTGSTTTESIFANDTNVVINDGSVDMDFRVESDSNANMLFVDAGNNRVGVGLGDPYSLMTIEGSSSGQNVLQLSNSAGTGDGGATNNLRVTCNGNTNWANLQVEAYQTVFKQNSLERLRLGISGAIFNDDSASNADFRVESDNSDHMLFVDAGNDRIGVNNASPSSTVHIGRSGLSDTGLTIQSATTSALITLNGRMNNSGSTTTAIEFKDGSTATSEGSITVTSSGTTYNTTSDRRLKDNIEPIADGTEKLMAMKPVTHTWKADPEADAVHGFIAQEMMDVVPEAVSGDPDGEEMMSMDYGRITPVLVAALQDAHKKIAALEERLAEMEIK
mgnify:CR=1 FL=1